MAIDQSFVARVLGINVEFRNFNLGQAQFLPQRLTVIGQGRTDATYDLDKFTVLSAGEVAEKYGYGSPLHLAIKQLFPDNNDGIGGIPVTIIPLEDAGTGVAAAGAITAVGTATGQATGRIILGGVKANQFVIAKDDTADAIATKIKASIDAVLDVPCTTGTVLTGSFPITAKWAGESGNDISIQIELDEGSGVTLSSTAFVNGAVNPDVDPALLKIGDVWETFILNCLNYDDTDTLDKFSTYGEGRWVQTVKKPLVVANGCVDNFATRTAITDVRKTDRVNFLVQATGSKELPFVVAARGLAKDIMPTANNKPATNYIGVLTGLVAGADDEQESENTRNLAVLAGASTNIKTNGLTELSDTITMYHPDGQPNPAFRYVVDIVKLQNILFNVQLILEVQKGKPLVPDTTVTADANAVQPKDIKTLLGNLADSLAGGISAIIVEPKFTKENLTAGINSQNPKRLDSTFPVKLSGNVEVNSNDIFFGFFLGA